MNALFPKGPTPIGLLQEAIAKECDLPHPFLNCGLYRLLGEWVALADAGARPRDAHGVCQNLARAGFVNADELSREFNSPPTREDPVLLGRHVVAQLISMCRSGMGVHGLLGEWLIELSNRPDLRALQERAQLEPSANAGRLLTSAPSPSL